MNPINRYFARLSVASGILVIIVFLMQIGTAPVLAPLVATIHLPVWLFLCILLSLPLVISVALKRVMAGHLSSSRQDQNRIALLEERCRALESQVQTLPALTSKANQGRVCAARLAEYESLKREIVGALKSGMALGKRPAMPSCDWEESGQT